MAIDSYSGLKSAVEDWLLRDDLGDTVEDFIHNAEQALNRDRRVRRIIRQTFSVDSESESLPSGFVELEALYHDGPTYHNRIEIVSPDMLSEVKRRRDGGHDDTDGVPTHASIIGGDTLRFAPTPDDEYDLQLVWWEGVPHLSDSKQTNWLIDDHSDIYLYASLVESAPYLHDEERLPMWRSELDKRIQDMHVDNERQQYSGSLVKQVRNHIP